MIKEDLVDKRLIKLREENAEAVRKIHEERLAKPQQEAGEEAGGRGRDSTPP